MLGEAVGERIRIEHCMVWNDDRPKTHNFEQQPEEHRKTTKQPKRNKNIYMNNMQIHGKNQKAKHARIFHSILFVFYTIHFCSIYSMVSLSVRMFNSETYACDLRLDKKQERRAKEFSPNPPPDHNNSYNHYNSPHHPRAQAYYYRAPPQNHQPPPLHPLSNNNIKINPRNRYQTEERYRDDDQTYISNMALLWTYHRYIDKIILHSNGSHNFYGREYNILLCIHPQN